MFLNREIFLLTEQRVRARFVTPAAPFLGAFNSPSELPAVTISNMDSGRIKADAVYANFFVEQSSGLPLRPVKEFVDQLPAALEKIGDAFVHNIASVISTMGMPLTLGDAAAQSRVWAQVLASERIRALKDDDRGSEDSERRAVIRANEEMEKHLRENGELFAEQVCDFLLSVHKTGNVASAVSELHGQGIVLVWSAFEVLVRDLFVFCLNSKPLLVTLLMKSEPTKRLFQVKGLDFQVLSEYDFDVSRAMGDILVQIHDLGNLPAMKVCFETLFPDDAELRESLGQKELWLLNQRRNLIVHRRGIIDQKYLDTTGEALCLGAQVNISSADVGQSLDTVCTAGLSLMKSCAGIC